MNSVVVVGNAPFTENEYGAGLWIDAHDTVVRFNNFQTSGYEIYRGTKTTIWVLIQNRWKVSQPRNEKIAWVWKVCPNSSRSEHPYHEQVVAGRPVWEITAKAILPAAEKIGYANPSTGALAVYFLTMAYAQISTIGFNHFESKNLHYYTDGQPEYRAHKSQKERQYFDHLRSGGQIASYSP